ncbi:MAG: TetR/AcrR family transcriptional regulator [Bacillota bacterium]|nr:TetR/AcrR family transcriptional regulator [Bacillota bacterium]
MKKGLKGIETKNKLLAIASDEFAEVGFDNTKIDTIVRIANLTKPSFYLYFKSKQAIFDELVAMCTTKLEDMVRKLALIKMDKDSSGSHRLRTVFESFFEEVLKNKELMIIGIELNTNKDKILHQLTDIVKENLRVESNINYIKPLFSNDIFASILVTNSIMLCRDFLLTKKSSPKELATILSSLFSEGILNSIGV